MNELDRDDDSIPLCNYNLVEEYKLDKSLVVSESTLRSLVIAPTKYPFGTMKADDLLNIKVALLLDPARVMAVNDSRKLKYRKSKEDLNKAREIVINIKEKLDVILRTIRELVLDLNDNRFNVLSLELRYSVLYSLDPDLEKFQQNCGCQKMSTLHISKNVTKRLINLCKTNT